MNTRHLTSRGILPLAALIASAVSAQAQLSADCKLSRVAGLMLTPNYSVPVVPVTLQGHPKFLIVDTGGYHSTISLAAARELGMEIGGTNGGIVNEAGKTSNSLANVYFQIGDMPMPVHLQFLIDPGNFTQNSDTRPIGSLGPEILERFDVDLDFSAGRLNLISQNHCPGQVVYWAHDKVAVIPFKFDRGEHITFPMMIDGKRLNAMLDTGATNTTMNLSTAKRIFDLDVNSPDVEKIGDLEGKSYTAAIYRRRFSSVQLEGVTVENPMISLMPDMITPRMTQPETGSMITRPEDINTFPDLTLGMSILDKLHVYIAYKERTLYITSGMPSAQ